MLMGISAPRLGASKEMYNPDLMAPPAGPCAFPAFCSICRAINPPMLAPRMAGSSPLRGEDFEFSQIMAFSSALAFT
jgi:hypothetical protein